MKIIFIRLGKLSATSKVLNPYSFLAIGVLSRGVFRGVLGVKPPPPFLRKIFQFARGFQEKNAKTPPKFSRPYKKILKPLPQKISGYVPGTQRSEWILKLNINGTHSKN